MKVSGRGGANIHEQWDGDAPAYLGITVPGFPNFFILYGPNTNIVVNGTIIWFSECEVRYVMDFHPHRPSRTTCGPRLPSRPPRSVQHGNRCRKPAYGLGRLEGK
jgi:cation diffusion facilitator CzcD-associated flavoprotein CzcO